MAAAAGADLLGLVGPMPSGPGVLSLKGARSLARTDCPGATPILLTSAETAEDIGADAEYVGVGAVQVVRHIAACEAAKLCASPVEYIQVIHVEGPEALELIETYAPHCDAFLLDSGKPSLATLGGTGDTHDWRISAKFVRHAPKPVYLAGGLNPDNVGAAIRQVQPSGLDICSGLRPEGRLDPARLSAFMDAVRSANA